MRWNGLLLPCGIMVPTVKRPLEAKARRSPHGAYDHRRGSRKVRLPGCRVAPAGSSRRRATALARSTGTVLRPAAAGDDRARGVRVGALLAGQLQPFGL